MTLAKQVMEGFLQAIVENPVEDTSYLVLADWLEENDDPRRAEVLRLHRRLLATCCEPVRHPERAGWQARIVELLTEGVRPCVPQTSVELREGVVMVFSFIPPGTFLMGRPEEETGEDGEVPQHRATLAKGFFLGVHQVTQAQWQAVMGSNPCNFKGDNLPVGQVSWEDCQEFCRKLGKWDGRKYRLPTEAEWEYACRAGTTTEYCSGNGLEAMQKVGWCSYVGGSAGPTETMPVGQFLPNAWGLYDMHGNVREWCLDGVRDYTSEGANDPLGPQGESDARVLRGGSWNGSPIWCRSACRGRLATSSRYLYNGCRVLLCMD